MSSGVGLEVGKYNKIPRSVREIHKPSSVLGSSTWIFGVSKTLNLYSISNKGGSRLLSKKNICRGLYYKNVGLSSIWTILLNIYVNYCYLHGVLVWNERIHARYYSHIRYNIGLSDYHWYFGIIIKLYPWQIFHINASIFKNTYIRCHHSS